MKKIDFKKPRYVFPLVILLPLVFLIYNVSNIFVGSSDKSTSVVTDSINTSLPEADARELEGKLSEMDKAQWGDSYTAVSGLGEDEEKKDESSQGYTEAELDEIDRRNGEREREAKEREDLERSLAESRRHVNSYKNRNTSASGRSSYPSSSSQYDDIDDYASVLDEIQRRNDRRNRRTSLAYTGDYDDTSDSETGKPTSSLGKEPKGNKESSLPKPEIVYKSPDKGADRFHTLSHKSSSDAALIKAIIDKTTKARTGTRLRFKLLDNVTIKGVSIPKGTYLYGTVTGFGNQRVTASISSILIKDKFVKINLSVYDNDGMEGFYVPESMFRSFVKEAGANAVNNNININSNGNAELSGEAVALQALQNLYSSATNAVSNNIRQDKARIKYNTTVYLINASSENN